MFLEIVLLLTGIVATVSTTIALRNAIRAQRVKKPDPYPFITVFSHAEIREQMEQLAREHLGVSVTEAMRMLDDGELDGTALEVEFKMRRFLLNEDILGGKK